MPAGILPTFEITASSPNSVCAAASADVTCRRCGISRTTLRLWLRRYRLEDETGLVGRSRRPKRSPRQKVFAEQRDQILSLRRERNLGARRIQIELRLRHEFELSITSVQKTPEKASGAPLRKPRRSPAPKRYSRPIPGDRVQMDTMKIVPGVYQYTAVDDCTRFDLAMAALWQSRKENNGPSAAVAADRPMGANLMLGAQKARTKLKTK